MLGSSTKTDLIITIITARLTVLLCTEKEESIYNLLGTELESINKREVKDSPGIINQTAIIYND